MEASFHRHIMIFMHRFSECMKKTICMGSEWEVADFTVDRKKSSFMHSILEELVQNSNIKGFTIQISFTLHSHASFFIFSISIMLSTHSFTLASLQLLFIHSSSPPSRQRSSSLSSRFDGTKAKAKSTRWIAIKSQVYTHAE